MVVIRIENLKQREAVHGRRAEQFAYIIDTPVLVDVAHEQAVIRIHPGGLFSELVAIYVKEGGCRLGVECRQFPTIIVEIKHKRRADAESFLPRSNEVLEPRRNDFVGKSLEEAVYPVLHDLFGFAEYFIEEADDVFKVFPEGGEFK